MESETQPHTLKPRSKPTLIMDTCSKDAIAKAFRASFRDTLVMLLRRLVVLG
jgi:hypothetical protein